MAENIEPKLKKQVISLCEIKREQFYPWKQV